MSRPTNQQNRGLPRPMSPAGTGGLDSVKLEPQAFYRSLHPWFPYLFACQGKAEQTWDCVSIIVQEMEQGGDIFSFTLVCRTACCPQLPPAGLLAVLQKWLPSSAPQLSTLIIDLQARRQGTRAAHETYALQGWVGKVSATDEVICLQFARDSGPR